MISGSVLQATHLNFAKKVVDWQKAFGRRHLPWQNTLDPYRVWLSEIMLQQTQVATVVQYYDRFLQRFPAVKDLAAASLDDVLALWSGLGYYSRARNMHRCAQQIVALHSGRFPASAVQLQTLPGIGPSTAAAIAAFCFAERVAILDGNVKRVLTRVLAFSGDLAHSAQERELWGLAAMLLPKPSAMMPAYTQGLMDIGATVCTAKKPRCACCPVRSVCKGLRSGKPEQYPVKTKKLKRSSEALSLLMAQKPDGSVWLERRPVAGIWGGLYCLPVFNSLDAARAVLQLPHQRIQILKSFKHVLTHKDLHLSPLLVEFPACRDMPSPPSTGLKQQAPGAWFNSAEWSALGLPAPVRKLLQNKPHFDLTDLLHQSSR